MHTVLLCLVIFTFNSCINLSIFFAVGSLALGQFPINSSEVTLKVIGNFTTTKPLQHKAQIVGKY